MKKTNKKEERMKRTFLKRHTDEEVRRAKAIALMSFKGGTGKTSLTAGLGLTLVRKGYDVLWIDNDAQCNLTQRVGWTTDMFRSQHKITNLLKIGDVALGDETGINSVLQIPLLIDYEYLYKLRGVEAATTGKLGIIGGSTFASIEAGALDDRYKKDSTAFEYPSMLSFFTSAIDVYKQYFDYILFDTAPSMEGNLLNVLTVVAADEVVSPVDGFEAATGIPSMLSFVKNNTNPSDLAPKGITKATPNVTFAMVKYQPDLKVRDSRPVIDAGLTGRNAVFRLLKEVLGDFVCVKGVQEKQKLRQAVSGFTTTDYTKLSLEIIEKIQSDRPSIYDGWNTDKRLALEIGLAAIEQMNLVKRPIFKVPVFR